jgi:DNA-binding NarL/FixJ family response regulator
MLGKLRILIADDHTLVRAGLVTLMNRMQDMEVVGEAGDGREALKLVRDLQPDIALMDIAMPGLNGLEAAERIRNDAPKTKVIILSMHAKEEYVAQALKAGASGYLLKDAATTELDMALKAVAQGQFYLSPSISRQVVDSYLHGGPTGLELLTPRQREILQLVAEGKSTREIAELLHLSVKTVETHRAQLMERLDIHDVAGLVRYALNKGLISH